MTRSPLAYPLNRGADMDVGGAADLQTDVMRFMAIISLCLVAIFALVQSMPISPPAEPVKKMAAATAAPQATPLPEPAPAPLPADNPPVEEPSRKLALTRPKWTPKFAPEETTQSQSESPPAQEAPSVAIVEPVIETAPQTVDEPEGFTLRFESDAVLTRLVAASRVGVYAIESTRAQRMTVSESRISFWDASVPNSFHEMELSTVPVAVVDALARTGTDTGKVSWGVTLPGKLKNQLDGLMQEHQGGSLVIAANGAIRLEES